MEEQKKLNKNVISIILKYASGMSIFCIMLAVVSSTLYDFGYFGYFIQTINSFPIQTSEIIKESMFLFAFSIVFLPLTILKLSDIDERNEHENIVKESEHKKLKKQCFYDTKAWDIITQVSGLVGILVLILIGWWFILYIPITIAMVMFCKTLITEKVLIKQAIAISFYIILLICSFVCLGYSKAAYDDKRILLKEEYIEMNNGQIMNNIKIIKAYDKGILILDNESLVFVMFSDIKRYSTGKQRLLQFLKM